jgi:hypothetical protein
MGEAKHKSFVAFSFFVDVRLLLDEVIALIWRRNRASCAFHGLD